MRAAAAVAETLLRLRFAGLPSHTLSGASLHSGADAESLEPAPHAAFFGELTAQPVLRHFNAISRREEPVTEPSKKLALGPKEPPAELS